jgi:PAS domain S-box-containing protein
VTTPTPDTLRFQARLLDMLGHAVIATDLEGVIRYWSRGAEAVFGWSADEALGQVAPRLTPAADELERSADIFDELRRGGSWSGEFLLRRRDGSAFPAHVTCTPILDEDNVLVGVVGVSVDMTTPRRAEVERADLVTRERTAQAQLDLVFQTASLGSWQLDGATMNLVASAACKASFGVPPEEDMTYARALEAVHPDDRERVHAAVTRAMTEGADYELEHRVVWGDGSVRWILARGRRFEALGGQPVRLLGITLDVTDRKRAEEERERLLARAEEANHAKDQFLATLSHELRTPLSATLGWVRLLRDGKLDAATARRALEIIERNVTAQARLIGDLLDVNRIERGTVDLERRAVEVGRLAGVAVESVQLAAAAKGLAVSVATAGDTTVVGDPERLQQVVTNLLTNAVKFTPAGGRVTVGVTGREDGVRLTVADTGKGISADFLPHVFDRFSQAERGTTRAHGGLGLGLAIVRHLVELHGGTVRAASAGEGRGATFTVDLPHPPAVSP